MGIFIYVHGKITSYKWSTYNYTVPVRRFTGIIRYDATNFVSFKCLLDRVWSVCGSKSFWCGSGMRIRIRLVTPMRIRILIFIWCGSGFDFSPWCGSGSRSYVPNKFSHHWKSAKRGSYSYPGYRNDADPCGSGSTTLHLVREKNLKAQLWKAQSKRLGFLSNKSSVN